MRVIQPVFTCRLDTASTALVSTSWSLFHSGINGPIKEIEIYNGTSQTIELAIGNSGAEQMVPVTIFPNGNPSIPVVLAHNTRLALRGAITSATAGLIILNGYR